MEHFCGLFCSKTSVLTSTPQTRWLYCVECPKYSTRLEALGSLCDCVSGRVQQVVKVICHKAHRRRRRMVQCYSTGDSNVSSHEDTFAPPGEYDWTCASFGPLQSTTETAPRSVQPPLHRWPQSVPIWFACFDLEIVPSHVGIWTSCNTWFIEPTRVRNANGNLIVSAVLGLTVVSWQTDRATDRPTNHATPC